MFPQVWTLHFFFLLVPVSYRDGQRNLQVQSMLHDKLSWILQIVWNQNKLFKYRIKNCSINQNFVVLINLFYLAIFMSFFFP